MENLTCVWRNIYPRASGAKRRSGRKPGARVTNSALQSRSQSPRSSVGGIVGLWEKAQKNAQNSLHSITIGSSTLGKRAIFKLLNDGALARS